MPKNCTACLSDDLESKPLIKSIFGEHEFVSKKSTGCAQCFGTGVKGRVLLFEHLFRHRADKSESQSSQSHTLSKFGSLKESAYEYLKKGEINAQNACAFD